MSPKPAVGACSAVSAKRIDLTDAVAMIAEGLRERDATVRLDDHHAPGESDSDLRAWWISGWACCPSAVTRPSIPA